MKKIKKVASIQATQTEQKAVGLKTKLEQNKNWSDRLADHLTVAFGSTGFLVANVLLFVVWAVVNTGMIPGIEVFDPFPFSMLTTIVSLEAIFLSIIVLMSQNRASKVYDVREELDLWINTHSEKEITKILNLLDDIHDHLGLENADDRELNAMKKRTNIDKVERQLVDEMGR